MAESLPVLRLPSRGQRRGCSCSQWRQCVVAVVACLSCVGDCQINQDLRCTVPALSEVGMSEALQRIESRELPNCSMEAFRGHDDDVPTEEKRRRTRELIGVDALFIIHYPPLVDRFHRLTARLRVLGVSEVATWVTWPLRQDLETMDPAAVCCVLNCQTHWFRWSTNGTKAVGMSHLWVYLQMQRHRLSHVVVMEDDPEFDPQFRMGEAFKGILSKLHDNYTAVMLGGCGFLHACGDQEHTVLELPWRRYRVFGPGYSHRCTSGYLLSLRGAETILRYVFDQTHGVSGNCDTILHGVIDSGGYWVEPVLWEQSGTGSHWYNDTDHVLHEAAIDWGLVESCKCDGCGPGDGVLLMDASLTIHTHQSLQRCVGRCVELEADGCVRVLLDEAGCALFNKGARSLESRASHASEICWVGRDGCENDFSEDCGTRGARSSHHVVFLLFAVLCVCQLGGTAAVLAQRSLEVGPPPEADDLASDTSHSSPKSLWTTDLNSHCSHTSQEETRALHWAEAALNSSRSNGPNDERSLQLMMSSEVYGKKGRHRQRILDI